MRIKRILTVSLLLAILCMSSAAFAALYEEDFDSYPPGSLPDNWSVHQGTWEIYDEALLYNDVDVWGAIRYNNGGAWADYALTVEANLDYVIIPSPTNNFAIGCRTNATGGGYWLRRVLDLKGRGGYIDLWRGTNFQWNLSKWLGEAPLPVDGVSHFFGLQFEGNTIRVYVDGVQKIQATDNTYASGSIAFKSDLGCLSWFDNVVVDNAPVPEPSSLIALAGGLLGIAGVLRRRIVN